MASLGHGRHRYILALDVGTSSIHCLLADDNCTPVMTASAPMRYFVPEGCPSVAKEFDPQYVLDTSGRLAGQVLSEAKVGPGDVSAIGITGQRQSIVFLDGDGRELYCGPNVDMRAVFEGAATDEEMGQEVYRSTGHCPSFLLTHARLRWFRERSTYYPHIRRILTLPAWLAYRLTGTLASEPSLDGEAGLLDICRRDRGAGMLEQLDIPTSLLPPLVPSGQSGGDLSRHMAESWRLEHRTPVFISGPDTQCGLLGMGLASAGGFGAVIGWSGAVQVVTSRPVFDDEMRTWVGCFPVGDMWVSETNLGDAGNAYRWLKEMLLPIDASFGDVERIAAAGGPAPDGVVALLGPGPVSSVKAGLKMGGLLFPTPTCFEEADRGQLFRAALHNIAYAVKANAAVLQDLTEHEFDTLYLGGGMARSKTLAAVLADVLGCPVRRSLTPDVSARGAAIIAALGTNDALSLDQVVHAVRTEAEEVEPTSASKTAEHQDHYRWWLELYERLV